MKELRIVERENIWCVEHLDQGKPDAEVVDLFDGEHVLPTPFMACRPVTEVIEELRGKSPDHLITLLDRRGKPVAANWYCTVYSTSTHEQWYPAGFCASCLSGIARCAGCGKVFHAQVTGNCGAA